MLFRSLQSVEYECFSYVDWNITLTYSSIGALNDWEIPITYNWASGGFSELFNRTSDSFGGFISSSSTSQNNTQTNYKSFTRTIFPPSAFPAWPSTPAEFSIRLGEPNYGRQANIIGDGSVARIFTDTYLGWDGEVKVYYVFS